MRSILFSAVAACGIVGASGAPLTVFSTDFESGVPSEISGVTTTGSVSGWAGLGPLGNQFSGTMLYNALSDASILTLNGLPAHTSVDINFLLAVLDSWDGLTGGAAPDYFNIRIDGTTTLVSSFEHGSTGDDLILPGTTHLSSQTSLGYGGFVDEAYDFSTTTSLSFPHTSSTLTVEFFSSGNGFQGGSDEGWGIDNLNVIIETVESTGVPDAGASAFLLAFGAAGMLIFKRRS